MAKSKKNTKETNVKNVNEEVDVKNISEVIEKTPSDEMEDVVDDVVEDTEIEEVEEKEKESIPEGEVWTVEDGKTENGGNNVEPPYCNEDNGVNYDNVGFKDDNDFDPEEEVETNPEYETDLTTHSEEDVDENGTVIEKDENINRVTIHAPGPKPLSLVKPVYGYENYWNGYGY